MNEHYLSVILDTRLFRGFSKDSFLNFFTTKDYKIDFHQKEEVIFFEDDHCKCLSFLLEGNVEIQKIDANGKVLTIASLEPGDVFGENLIFGDRNKYPMTVVAKTNAVVFNISKATVIDLCQVNSVFLNEIMRILSNKAVALSKKLKEVTLKTIRQKICEFLYQQFKQQKTKIIKIGMSKKDWADKIGVQRPSLSRELINLKDEGLIDYDKDTVTIIDVDLIEECM